MANRKQIMAAAGAVMAAYLMPLGSTAVGAAATCPPVPPRGAHEGRYQGLDMAVQKVTISKGTRHDQPRAGHAYYVLHVAIVNRSCATATYNSLSVVLEGRNGTAYMRMSASFVKNQLAAGTLAAGKRITGAMVFEAPSRGDYRLVWRPSLGV